MSSGFAVKPCLEEETNNAFLRFFSCLISRQEPGLGLAKTRRAAGARSIFARAHLGGFVLERRPELLIPPLGLLGQQTLRTGAKPFLRTGASVWRSPRVLFERERRRARSPAQRAWARLRMTFRSSRAQTPVGSGGAVVSSAAAAVGAPPAATGVPKTARQWRESRSSYPSAAARGDGQTGHTRERADFSKYARRRRI